eukprot:1238454-Prorocentrum_lima.AAC.1
MDVLNLLPVLKRTPYDMVVVLGWELHQGRRTRDELFIISPVHSIAVMSVTSTANHNFFDDNNLGEGHFFWM